jgi:hypothetical protein
MADFEDRGTSIRSKFFFRRCLQSENGDCHHDYRVDSSLHFRLLSGDQSLSGGLGHLQTLDLPLPAPRAIAQAFNKTSTRTATFFM